MKFRVSLKPLGHLTYHANALTRHQNQVLSFDDKLSKISHFRPKQAVEFNSYVVTIAFNIE